MFWLKIDRRVSVMPRAAARSRRGEAKAILAKMKAVATDVVNFILKGRDE